MKNYERLANRCSALEKRIGKEDEVETFTLEEIRRTPWLAVPEDYGKNQYYKDLEESYCKF